MSYDTMSAADDERDLIIRYMTMIADALMDRVEAFGDPTLQASVIGALRTTAKKLEANEHRTLAAEGAF